MSENTKIEWCDHTFNPWEGCQKVGPGCDHCYAETRNARFAGGTAINWGPGAPRRRTSASNWNKPRAWNAKADAFFAEHGRRQRVFCASLADVFDNAVDPQWRADLFALIHATPNLDWLLLTKRIGNVPDMLVQLSHGSDPDLTLLDMMPLPNVWIGATITSQAEAGRDIPKLLAVPAAKRFLSMEPLLGSVNLTPFLWSKASTSDWMGDPPDPTDPNQGHPLMRITGIDWVIVGGESGPGARPMHPEWARSLRDQCQAAGTPFLFKQWGEWMPGSQLTSNGKIMSQSPESWTDGGGDTFKFPMAALDGSDGGSYRVGKKTAGRFLDGRSWDGFPA